jgi:hypothetical protein
VLNVGWHEIIGWIRRPLRLPTPSYFVIYLITLLFLDSLALFSIVKYYF